jgi:hypothetical protein
MRYAIDVVQEDGSCRTLVVDVIGGDERALTVLIGKQAKRIEWKLIASWSPIDEESRPIILDWIPKGLVFPVCF